MTDTHREIHRGLGHPVPLPKTLSWRQQLKSPIPWLVLLLSSALCVFIASVNHNSVKAKNNAQFERKTEALESAIYDHLVAYRNVLYGFSGLLSQQKDVDREQWRHYYNTLRLEEFYPGIQGVGFARRLTPESVAPFEQRMHEAGFDDFAVKPKPSLDVASAIEVLEPFDWRNQRAFGYDMYSNDTRRAAMQASWDNQAVAISGRVTLLQEADSDPDPQVGFLMYLAYFVTPSEANKNDQTLVGWVYAPFRMNDFMRGVFPMATRQLQYEIHDQAPGKDSLLFRSTEVPSHYVYQTHRVIQFGQREWHILAKSLPAFERQTHNDWSSAILVAGGIESLLLFIMCIGYLTSRHESRVRAELLADRQASEDRVSIILNATTTALITVDVDGSILEANRQAAELFGYSRQTLLSMKVEALLPMAHREAHVSLRKAFVLNAEKRVMGQGRDLHAQDFKGELIPVEVGLSPIQTESGLKTLATIVDIRERIKAQNERERMMSQLAEKNVEMEQFVYTVSHDLKSPLVTINGFVKMLSGSLAGRLDDKQAHWLSRIGANVQSMEGLLNDLLELSRIIHRELELEDLDVESTVKEALNALALQIRESAADVVFDFKVTTIVAHKRLLVQCIQNLVSNAIQYRKSGQTCKIAIRSRYENHWMVIEVADNGIGIDSKYQARVFEIFERLSANSSSGSGVGLAVVKTAVEKHGGYVSLKSELNQGATFSLYFPR